MYHPEYAWMFFNWYMDRWWSYGSSCSAQNLETVIETSIAIDNYPRIDEEQLNDPNIGNIVSNCHIGN